MNSATQSQPHAAGISPAVSLQSVREFMQSALAGGIHDDNWQHYDAQLGDAIDAYASDQRKIAELVEALEEAVEIIEAKTGGRYVKARAALSAAKEGQP